MGTDCYGFVVSFWRGEHVPELRVVMAAQHWEGTKDHCFVQFKMVKTRYVLCICILPQSF